MAKKLVLVKSMAKANFKEVLTSEGVKKLNDKKEILISVGLALQLVDGVNWSCEEDLKKLAKELRIQQANEDDAAENSALGTSNQNDDEDEEEVEDDEIKKDEEDAEEMGDEEIKDLIKRLPKMKFLALKTTAEEVGIDVSGYTKTKEDKTKLIKAIIKILKGK